MTDKEQLYSVIPISFKGLRLDNALVQLFPDYSRARLQKWIRSGDILVDGKTLRPKNIVSGGEEIKLQATLSEEVSIEPQAIDLDIVYEDHSILVVNKPAGLVVHPGAGNSSGTMVNALLHHDPSLRSVPRVGIVHRLDKGTSGLLVVAKQLQSHINLVEQLQQREVSRKYIALAHGEIIAGGTVNTAIGRHPVDRKRMAVISSGKPAITHYRVRQRYKACTLLDVQLETGRTHQIRVHMAHLHNPLVGDAVYGGKIKTTNDLNRSKLAQFPRQALLAASLAFKHPDDQRVCEWSVPIPEDFQQLLNVLE